MAGHLVEVTDANFRQEVLESPIPVLIDFWAEWCAPCRVLAPTVEAIAEEYQGKIKVAKMNVDDSPNTPSVYGIRGIPTLILFKDGQEKDRIIGVTSKENIVRMINAHLG
ncbi:MAG TPA: thioredoxin [Blastocatellia bacterium]|nr:thioredoxin [Blastocatellia bacterium]